jgi:hypothetical protein
MADEKPQDEYYVVILQADGEFSTESFPDVAALAARLKALIDRDVSVSCFKGARLKISKPPYRYLLTPEANIALYDVPEEIEPDETGYLGVDPTHLEGPPQLNAPAMREPTTQPDEFFSDQSDEIRNIFDDVLPDPDA